MDSVAADIGPNRWKYQSNEYIKDFGLNWMDFQARQYDPQLGRFLAVDPLADGEGQEIWSPYAAMGNAPESMIDPNGTDFYMDPKLTTEKDGNEFLSMLSGLTGLEFDWDMISGKVTIKNQLQKEVGQGTSSGMKEGSGGGGAAVTNTISSELTKIVTAMITDPNVKVNATIVNHSDDILFDNFLNGQIDLDDLKSVSGYSEFLAGQLGHIFSERIAVQGTGGYMTESNREQYLNNWAESSVHKKGLSSEVAIIKGMSGKNVSKRVDNAYEIKDEKTGLATEAGYIYDYGKFSYQLQTVNTFSGQYQEFIPGIRTPIYDTKKKIITIKKD